MEHKDDIYYTIFCNIHTDDIGNEYIEGWFEKVDNDNENT
jgi:hypothetical protein